MKKEKILELLNDFDIKHSLQDLLSATKKDNTLLNQLDENVRRLEVEKSQLIDNIRGLEGEKSQLIENVRRLEGEKFQLSGNIRGLEGEKSQLNDNIRRLEAKNLILAVIFVSWREIFLIKI